MLSSDPAELPAILFVDDEQKTCKHFGRLFSNRFRIHTASDGLEAMEIFKVHHADIGVIVTDQRMPNETGTEFLQKAAHLKPTAKRILSTAYVDVDAAIDAVNTGGIYRYITKPWEVSELEVTLVRAMELYLLENEREELLTKKVANVESIAVSERVHALAALAVFKSTDLRHIAPAIGSLIKMGEVTEPSVNTTSWDEAYRHHRQFLELAHAALNNHLDAEKSFDQRQTISSDTLISKLEDCDLGITVDRECETNLPGPLDVLTTHLSHLIDGLRRPLADTDQVSLRITPQGLELLLSALPIQYALRPMFGHGPVTIAEGQPCLDLVAAVISWHHHGGTLSVKHDQGILRLGLSSSQSAPSSDPWLSLAADLVGNTFFWEKQL